MNLAQSSQELPQFEEVTIGKKWCKSNKPRWCVWVLDLWPLAISDQTVRFENVSFTNIIGRQQIDLAAPLKKSGYLAVRSGAAKLMFIASFK